MGEKPSGNAFVQLRTKDDVEKAMQFNRVKLLKRTVDIEDISVAQKYDETTDDDSLFIKLSNIPRGTKEDEVATFLNKYDVKYVKFIITKKQNGNASGDAFVKLDQRNIPNLDDPVIGN